MDFKERLEELVLLCRKVFRAYDEVWVVGAKGDHHVNLIDLGVLERQQVSLVHVHNRLGISPSKDVRVIDPPAGSSNSFESIFSELNPNIIEEIDRVVSQDKQVCVLMPFPNVQLNKVLRLNDRWRHFTVTSPVEDDIAYTNLESKLGLRTLIESASPTLAQKTLIPSLKISDSDSFEDIRHRLMSGQVGAIYVQQDVSVGGEGTVRVHSQAQLDALFGEMSWRQNAIRGLLKATPEVRNAYPANGSACIIPVGNGECKVYIDPLSHKPTGIEETGMKENCGSGNDWTIRWPESVQEQYIEATTLIGRELYKNWGYTGIFGPDHLVEETAAGPALRITEINPRWQGTTPYQTYNALISQRLPLELIHYIIKLDKDGHLLPRIHNLLGDANTYNRLSTESSGCFYIKIGTPKDSLGIKEDLNGSWWFDGVNIHRAGDSTYRHLIEDYQNATIPVIIKSPRMNAVSAEGFMAVAYVIGRSKEPVFLDNSPQLSDYGASLLIAVQKKLYEELRS